MERGTILVTGGAGYIGSHAVLSLLERGEKVVVLDDLSTGSRERVPEGAEFREGDIADRELLKNLFASHAIECVMHFAGVVRVEESVRDPQKYFRINVEATRILAEEVRAAGVPCFIFSSSASVYGDAKDIPVNEDAPLAPVSPYAETKQKAEEELRRVFGDAVRTVILRYFNVAGADSLGRGGYRTDEKPTHMIRSAVRANIRGESFTIFGTDYPTPDGSCIRDYIHVNDLADAHVAALGYLRDGGLTRVFNCGSGHGYSNLEVIRSVQRVAKKEMQVHMGPRRPGDPPALVADITRISRELGWKPRFKLDDMISHELTWTQKHLV
jgi:UDP-glucose 4-epimerase